MPNEARRLVFNKTEVAQALIDFNRHSSTKILAQGTLSAMIMHGGPSLNIEVSVETSEGYRQDVAMDRAIVAAAIIRYCIDRKVPLPLKADKMLEVMNDKLVLDIHLPPRAALAVAASA